MMPSKNYSALVPGQAVLAACADDSDLEDLIREHECGWVVASGGASDQMQPDLNRLARMSVGR